MLKISVSRAQNFRLEGCTQCEIDKCWGKKRNEPLSPQNFSNFLRILTNSPRSPRLPYQSMHVHRRQSAGDSHPQTLANSSVSIQTGRDLFSPWTKRLEYALSMILTCGFYVVYGCNNWMYDEYGIHTEDVGIPLHLLKPENLLKPQN